MRMIWTTVMAGVALSALSACGSEAAEVEPHTLADTQTADITASDEADARTFIEGVLGAYKTDETPNYMGDPAPVFEPELASRIAVLNAEGGATGSVPDALGADAICGCQDYGGISYAITSLTVDGEQAEAIFTLTNFGETEERSFTLAKTGSGWRIYDIDESFRASVMAVE